MREQYDGCLLRLRASKIFIPALEITDHEYYYVDSLLHNKFNVSLKPTDFGFTFTNRDNASSTSEILPSALYRTIICKQNEIIEIIYKNFVTVSNLCDQLVAWNYEASTEMTENIQKTLLKKYEMHTRTGLRHGSRGQKYTVDERFSFGNGTAR